MTSGRFLKIPWYVFHAQLHLFPIFGCKSVGLITGKCNEAFKKLKLKKFKNISVLLLKII